VKTINHEEQNMDHPSKLDLEKKQPYELARFLNESNRLAEELFGYFQPIWR
jgi:transposase